MVKVVPLQLRHIADVAANPWEVTKDEWEKFGYPPSSYEDAVDNMPTTYSGAIEADGVTVGIMGGGPTPKPGVWEVWFIGADIFPLVWRDATAKMRAMLIEGGALEGAKVFRLVSCSAHPRAVAWHRKLGFRRVIGDSLHCGDVYEMGV